MNNDIIPRRGAERSVSRTQSNRPVPVMSRQALNQAYGAPQSVRTNPVIQPQIEQTTPTPPIQPATVSTGPIQDVAPRVPKRQSVAPPVVTQVAPLEKRGDLSTPKPPSPQQPSAAVQQKRKWYHLSKRSVIVTILIVLILSVTTYIGIDTWVTNSHVKAQLTPVKQSVQSGVTAQADEGTDIAPVPVSALDSYTVAPDLPRALMIDKLSIAARVMPMGVNKDNSMQAPTNINDSGWYTGSSKPGMPGAMVIDGHSSATNAAVHLGLFNAIGTLNDGDIVTIEKGDGTKLAYKVVHKETVALADIDMQKVMLPYNGATQGLNLITCAGQWTTKDTTLDHRTIVYTVPVTS